MDFNEYKNAVELCARNHTDYLFHNEGAEHAVVILSNIFMNSQDRVRMASNRLINKEIVGNEEYRKALITFLNRPNTYLDIMLTHAPTEEQVTEPKSIFFMLYYHPAYKDNRITIKDSRGKTFMDKEHHPVNFCTGDSNMYRVETDVEKWRAIANFQDSNRTKLLTEKFDYAFNSLSEIVLNDYFEQNDING